MTGLETITLTTAILGAVCGVVGAILGVLNTCYNLSKNRVRLRVVPKIAYMVGGGHVITGERLSALKDDLDRSGAPARLCIEVVNLSAFPVTISSVGFGRADHRRSILIRPETTPKRDLPVRLESREAVTMYGAIGEDLDANVMREPVAWAETDCDVLCYGSSPLFKDYVRQLQIHQEEST